MILVTVNFLGCSPVVLFSPTFSQQEPGSWFMDVMPPFFERQGTAEVRHRAPTYRRRWVKNDGSGTLGFFTKKQRSPDDRAALL